MKLYIHPILFTLFLIMGCSSSTPIESQVDDNTVEPPTNGDTNTWLLPISQVRDGGPGRDGIPSINDPEFIDVSEAPGILRDEVRVVGIKIGSTVRAYPHYILDWHEVVNDDIKSTSVAITYCPLTGSAIAWNRRINGRKTSFGVSGLLYNNNVIPFDRTTNSNWSQLGLQCVNGTLIGETPEVMTLVETNWFIWKAMFPETTILSTNTGFDRTYGVYPYGDYITNNNALIFPLTKDDRRLPRKERVHAIVDENQSKVYRFNTFGGGKAIKDTFNGKNILLVGGNETIVSFELNSENTLSFKYIFNTSEAYFEDSAGTVYNVFGQAISGPGKGKRLKATNSFIAYWFSIGAFYPNPEIFE